MQNKPLTSDEIKTITIAVQCFKENELPDKDRAYSSDAEISAGLDLFVSYCKRLLIQDVESINK